MEGSVGRRENSYLRGSGILLGCLGSHNYWFFGLVNYDCRSRERSLGFIVIGESNVSVVEEEVILRKQVCHPI